ncbi:MAG: type II secretion system F family protein [Patescibacteria group bacterium]
MLFNYQALDNQSQTVKGSIDAISIDVAISSLQHRGFIISSIAPASGGTGLNMQINWFNRIKTKDIVLLSRQLATLFQAQVSALRIFRLISAEAENPTLQSKLLEIADDLQGGNSISKSLSKHPDVFSDFYVNMVRSGEEAGKLDQTFEYLADYLERSYEILSKARGALIYPAFVVVVFISVMVLMLVLVIPNLSATLIESGQEIPVYTKGVIAVSNLFVHYGIILLIVVVGGGVGIWRWGKTKTGALAIDTFKLKVPYLGTLYSKIYLARISDNLNTLLQSAIPIVKTLEITSSVIDNVVYKAILSDTIEGVKAGNSISDSMGRHPEIPGIMIQMMKVGEETGELGSILKTLSRFYAREVSNAVDALVSLIEPAMVVGLGLGVGFLFAAILIPIYNISAAQ